VDRARRTARGTVPVRVVSHSCSNTEIVCALGCADLLVGVDQHSDHPPEIVGSLARVGPDLHVDVGLILALAPDLVLYSLTIPGHEIALAELQAANVPVLVLAPKSLDDVYADVVRIADALGVHERGVRLAAEMKAAIGGDPPLSWRPRVLVEWWPKPVIAAGRRSWVTDLLRLAGGINALEDRDVASTPLGDDEVVALAPNAVVIAWCGVPAHKYRPDIVASRAGWRDVPAVRDACIYPITEAWLGRPGPRLVDGYRALRQILETTVG
jgi:iron complex transport system substrate-binding protein